MIRICNGSVAIISRRLLHNFNILIDFIVDYIYYYDMDYRREYAQR